MAANMKTLYKYYSDKLDIKKHLVNPSIKLATTASLNDPFEKQLSYQLTKTLSEIMLDEKTENAMQKERLIQSYSSAYTNVSKSFGVVSLTETHENVLMWAHYAASHKGYCIGYNDDLFDDLYNVDHGQDKWRGIYKPEKINYTTKRFQKEDINLTSNKNALILNAMLKKSPDWEYEHEYRSIIPFYLADRFTIPEDSDKNNNLTNQIKRDEQHKIINKSTNSFGYEIILPKNNAAHPHLMEKYAGIEGVMIFKDIDLKSINSIFIGSQVDDEEVNEIVRLVNSNKEKYGHISVYKYNIHRNEFKIYTDGLVNSKILNNIENEIIETNICGFEL